MSAQLTEGEEARRPEVQGYRRPPPPSPSAPPPACGGGLIARRRPHIPSSPRTCSGVHREAGAKQAVQATRERMSGPRHKAGVTKLVHATNPKLSAGKRPQCCHSRSASHKTTHVERSAEVYGPVRADHARRALFRGSMGSRSLSNISHCHCAVSGSGGCRSNIRFAQIAIQLVRNWALHALATSCFISVRDCHKLWGGPTHTAPSTLARWQPRPAFVSSFTTYPAGSPLPVFPITQANNRGIGALRSIHSLYAR